MRPQREATLTTTHAFPAKASKLTESPSMPVMVSSWKWLIAFSSFKNHPQSGRPCPRGQAPVVAKSCAAPGRLQPCACGGLPVERISASERATARERWRTQFSAGARRPSRRRLNPAMSAAAEHSGIRIAVRYLSARGGLCVSDRTAARPDRAGHSRQANGRGCARWSDSSRTARRALVHPDTRVAPASHDRRSGARAW